METRNYETYLPLIIKVVNKFCKNNRHILECTEKQDLIQEMYFVFEDCDKIFDPKKCDSFKALLTIRCKNKLSNIWRENKKHLQIEDIDDLENELFIDDKSENCHMAYTILEYIKEDENSKLLTDYFVKDFKQCDLAVKYNKSTSMVNRIISEFRQDIKEMYSEI
jgi:RNA polymerase sigma factor (sigma-70 family)